jgi:flagellar basal body rod protein FlgC
MRLYRLCGGVCLLTFAVAACAGTALHVGTPQNANSNASTTSSPANQNNKSAQAVYSLDLQNPEITQKILPDDGDAAKARFVQVQIVTVTNPQKHPAQFEVHYQPDNGERILLGGFSLYPPDNPGKFIVPTQGKVKSDGVLILSLVKSDRIAAGDVLKVTVMPMKFVNGK